MDFQLDSQALGFLRCLARTNSLSELLELVLEQPTWMVEAKSRSLQAIVARHQADSIRGRVDWLVEIAELAQFVATTPSFDDYAKRAASQPVLVSTDFRSFMGALLKQQGLSTDALASLDEAIASRTEQVNQVLHLVENLPEQSSDDPWVGVRSAWGLAEATRQRAPLAVAQSTLNYFDAQLRIASRHANTGSDRGEQLALALETLETIGFNVRQLEAGRPTMRGMNSGTAAVWYVRAVPSPLTLHLIEAVRSAKLSFDEAVERVQGALLAEMATRPVSRIERSFSLATALGAFCVLSASMISTLEYTRVCLARFRGVLESAWTAKLTHDYRASLIWRYCAFVLMNLAEIEDLKTTLEDCSLLLADCTAQVSQTDHPGLTRDLNLAHARVLVELTRWLPERVTTAIELFETGLSVPWARYDREARGRGLMDLAGALARSIGLTGADVSVATESRIVWLYNQARFFLTLEDFRVGRMTVLMNCAIFFNERKYGDYAENQERALALIDEAVAISRDLEGQPGSPMRSHAAQVRASAWQTRGNIIRMRTHGGRASPDSTFLVSVGTLPEGMSQWAVGALSCYHEALRLLDGADICTPLRAQVHLNMAVTYVDEYRFAPSAAKASRADVHLRQAREFIADVSQLDARAKLIEFELELLHGGTQPQTKAETSARLAQASQSARRLADAGYVETAVGAAVMVATQSIHTGRKLDLAVAEACLNELLAFTRSRSSLASVYCASLLVQLMRISEVRASQSEDGTRYLERAIEFGTEAFAQLRDELRAHNLMGNRLSTAGRLVTLATDLAWLRLRTAPDEGEVLASTELAELLVLAADHNAGVDAGGEPAVSLEAARSRMFGAEAQIWSRSDEVFVEQSIAREFDSFRAARAQFEVECELSRIAQEPAQSTPAKEVLLHHATTIQLVVSEWGSYAIVYREGRPKEFVPLELSRADVGKWVDAWLSRYRERSGSQRGRDEWASVNQTLSADIGERVWAPLTEAGISLNGLEIVVMPGALAGLPLHAGRLGDGRYVVEVVGGIAYATSTHYRPAPALERAVIALSDPKRAGQERLESAPREVSAMAKICADGGASVEVLLDAWGEVTRESFVSKGCPLPDAVKVIGRPTQDRVLERIAHTDLFLYSGHGNGIGSLGGHLVLVDDEGAPAKTSIVSMMRLQLLHRRPAVVLSACETAWEVVGPAQGSSSVASTFIRLGASSVMGSLWKIPDAEATQVSCRYVEEVTGRLPPSRAFVETIRDQIAAGKPVSRWAAYCLWLG